MNQEHVAAFAPAILETVMRALPASDQESATMRANISGAIADGRLQVWGILGKLAGTEQWRPVGYGTTAIKPDEMTGTSSLLIYSLFVYATMDDSVYAQFWQVLTDYAKSEGCAKIVLFSNNERIIAKAREYNFETSFRYIFRNVE